jgi:Glycosyltransferases involved in cell wall biogenesis
MFLTVITPAYNRASLLERLYNSLKGQNFTDFEWIIIDDGSTDNTKQTVESFFVDNTLRV